MSNSVLITIIICVTIVGLALIGELGGKKWNMNL
jgi:hypothetical protein